MRALTVSDKTVGPSPARIIDMVMNYRASKVLLVAVFYDVFSLIADGFSTTEKLSRKMKTDGRATEMLLDALVSLLYLEKNGGVYSNAPLSDAYLVQGKAGYLGNNLKYQEMIWDAWSDLKGVLKRGRPKNNLNEWLMDKAFTRDYIRGMANIARRPAREIVALLEGIDPKKILDVGAGPGVYALAFLEKYPSATATLLDLPSTINLTKSLLKSHPHSKRVSYVRGDYHSSPFGRSRYDIVIMSHITHDEGPDENRELIKKAFHALKPGGKIIIHDFMADANHVPRPFLSLFSVHMLVYTKKGKVYSAQVYKSWLEEAGFRHYETHDIAGELPNASKALIGTR